MIPAHQVLVLSNDPKSMVQHLESIIVESRMSAIRFIHPSKIYRSDLIESVCVLMDFSWLEKNPGLRELVLSHSDKLGILATVSGQEDMNRILKDTGACHFFGMSGTHTFHDIVNFLNASIEKYFWTAETFIEPPVTAKSHSRFESSENLEQQIIKALEPHDLLNTFDGFKPILEKILNETLTNALYNAPVDPDGNPIHRARNRKEIVLADPDKVPTLDIIEDADKIILTVRDFYGSLTKKVIDHFLTHGQIAEKEGGAGVGLFLILRDAHKLVINIEPGKTTEFIIVLHKFKRFFHYQVLEKSFHLFERKSS